jgi:flagellar hook assembly protein FlgD
MNGGFELLQNSPNPFNATTTIRFTLPHEGSVQIRIFNLRRDLVKTLVDSYFSTGTHSIVWDCSDNTGAISSPGIYFYKITFGNFNGMKKMLLMK